MPFNANAILIESPELICLTINRSHYVEITVVKSSLISVNSVAFENKFNVSLVFRKLKVFEFFGIKYEFFYIDH
jgi:hypothetical protein